MQKSMRTKADIFFDGVNVTLMLIILVIVLYPLIFVLSASFSNPLAVLEGKVVLFPVDYSLQAYKAVFKNDDILMGYKNTIIYTIAGTAVNLVMTIMGAYPLSRKDFKGRRQLTIFFMITMFFSGGLIPSYLVNTKLGLNNNFWVMIIPGAISVWNMFIMKSFFQTSIPDELEEAAFIDGASNIGILIKIVLPLSTPILAVLTMYYGVGHWNSYFTALIYFRDRAKYPLQLILREILVIHDMGEMTESEVAASQELVAEGIKYAVIVVASLPVLLMYPFLQRHFVKGVMLGAIKG